MANNILAGKLNFIVYSGDQPGRLTGTIQAGEVDISAIFTTTNTKIIYLATDVGGFNSFNPQSAAFSVLKVLQPGTAYAVDALQSFEFADCVPPPNATFKTNLLTWFRANKPA